jgi:predicted dehydrogenase
VLCEKPMANSPAECEQMIAAGRKANRKLMVAYRCRYEPYNQEAIRMARSQELGPTQAIWPMPASRLAIPASGG